MTERQIENLKKLLSNSTLESPTELDDKIRLAAKTEVANAYAVKEQAAQSKPFLRVPQFGALGTAALSVLVTASLFLGLNQILSVDMGNDLSNNTSNIENSPQGPKVALIIEPTISAPPETIVIPHPETLIKQFQIVDTPESQSVRDQILAQLEIPDTSDVLRTLDLPLPQDRQLAKKSIDLAMTDIRQFIGSGHLNKARERYARLKTVCHNCSLPDTLETLVINAHQRSKNIPVSNSS